MQAIRVACPHCGAAIRAPSAARGKTFKCPKCGEGLVIQDEPPQLPQLKQGDAADAGDAAQPSASPDRAPPSDDLVRIVGAIHDVRDAVQDTTADVAYIAIRAFVWFLAIGWTGFVAFGYSMALTERPSAIQQAGLAADACLWILIGYVAARAVDSATRA